MNHMHVVKWAYEKNLLPYVPIRFGGLGLPSTKMKNYRLGSLTTSVRKGLLALALRPKPDDNISGRCGLWDSAFFSAARMGAAMKARAEISLDLETRKLLYVRKGRRGPRGYATGFAPEESPTPEDWQRSLTQHYFYQKWANNDPGTFWKESEKDLSMWGTYRYILKLLNTARDRLPPYAQKKWKVKKYDQMSMYKLE